MLFSYEHIKQDPVIVWKDKIFVQNGQKDHISFRPKHLLFLTLSSPQLSQITDKDLFVFDSKMTEDYKSFQKLKAEKEKILPLLRAALLDESLADINHFPLGRQDHVPRVSTQNLSEEWGKVEILKRIAWLGDKKAIPELRELLFHGKEEDYDLYNDMTYIKNFRRIKSGCIEALVDLWAKNVLFEYLLQKHLLKPLPNRYIQEAMTGLIMCWLSNSDLPKLMQLVERYEWQDQDAYDLHAYYLTKLFFAPWGWSMRQFEFHGVIHDWDSDAPAQRLICKALARMGTAKSVEMLIHIHQHASYFEMRAAALIGIRHRRSAQRILVRKKLTQVPIALISKIGNDYCQDGEAPAVSDWNLLYVKFPHAITQRPYMEAKKREEERENAEKLQEEERLAKNAEYFRTLKPGDTVRIENPFNYYHEECIGTVIKSSKETIKVKGPLSKKGALCKRKFFIKNWKSIWPAYIADIDDDGDKAYFYKLQLPEAPKEKIRCNIPEETKIIIVGKKYNTDDDLPY